MMLGKSGLRSVCELLCEASVVDTCSEFVLSFIGAPVRKMFLPVKQVTDYNSFKPNLMTYGGSISPFLVGKNYLVFLSQVVSQAMWILVLGY